MNSQGGAAAPAVRQAENVVACELEGGKALLDLSTSNYYKLNETAALVWEWIGAGATVSSLVERMMDSYDVSQDECTADVEAIIADFRDSGLVEAGGASSA